MPSPVQPITKAADQNEDGPIEGIGLALSGGGYRAMLFHTGSLLRLYEIGLLEEITRISSVSGGSIAAAKMALEWHRLTSRDEFMKRVVTPIRNLASITVDAPSVIGGLLLPGSISNRVAAIYRKHLYGDATLQELPDEPRFVINATNVETGSLWRFSKPYMRDYKVGKVEKPRVSLAAAVAASSAFPPVLSPFVLDVDIDDFDVIEDGIGRQHLEEVSLTDGGVYDNLGLETVWKRYKTVLVSDAGQALEKDSTPAADWARHSKRVLEIIYEQVASVRKRQVIAAFKAKEREGAYWGIRTDVSHYQVGDALPAPHERTLALAETPTRLKRLDASHQERLINWGYAACDAAIRKHFRTSAAAPRDFPYPAAKV